MHRVIHIIHIFLGVFRPIFPLLKTNVRFVDSDKNGDICISGVLGLDFQIVDKVCAIVCLFYIFYSYFYNFRGLQCALKESCETMMPQWYMFFRSASNRGRFSV